MILNGIAAMRGALRCTFTVRCAPIDDEASCRRRRSEIRDGFTLVELLVVIAKALSTPAAGPGEPIEGDF